MSEARADARNLTRWQFLLLVVVYAAIIQVGGRVIGADVDSDEGWASAGNILEASLIPIISRGGGRGRSGSPCPSTGRRTS